MKYINLALNDKLFYKLKDHKLKLEKELNERLSWESYIMKIFGFNERRDKNDKDNKRKD